MKVNLKEIEVGDVFSEESHYVVKKIDKAGIVFNHLESGKEVTLNNKYVEELLNTSDQYTETKTVTREDKKDGTPGIRTIFEGIKSSEVFTVVFTKQDTPKTAKAISAEKEEVREKALEIINKAKTSKKSMADAYAKALEYVQDNPVLDHTPGERRVLRGYKLQFVSRDGKYRCIDMDITDGNAERLVNINTISELVLNGVKYIVK